MTAECDGHAGMSSLGRKSTGFHDLNVHLCVSLSSLENLVHMSGSLVLTKLYPRIVCAAPVLISSKGISSNWVYQYQSRRFLHQLKSETYLIRHWLAHVKRYG